MPSINNLSQADFLLTRNREDFVCIRIADIIEGLVDVREGEHLFAFADIEEDEDIIDLELGFNQEIAQEIYQILIDALNNNQSILVHCHQGLSRSGAIVEFATELGFIPEHNNREPNSLVYQLLQEERD